MMATIGRKRAVAQVGGFKLTGFVAWVVWCVAHIYFLIGFKNRLSVAMNWLWSYVTSQRGTRLITGLSGSRMEGMPEPPLMELPEERDDHPHHGGEEHSRLQMAVATPRVDGHLAPRPITSKRRPYAVT